MSDPNPSDTPQLDLVFGDGKAVFTHPDTGRQHTFRTYRRNPPWTPPKPIEPPPAKPRSRRLDYPYAVIHCWRRIPQPIFMAAMTQHAYPRWMQIPKDCETLDEQSAYVRGHLPERFPGFGKPIAYSITTGPEHTVFFRMLGDILCTTNYAQPLPGRAWMGAGLGVTGP